VVHHIHFSLISWIVYTFYNNQSNIYGQILLIKIKSIIYFLGDALSGKTAITQMFLSDGSKFTKSYNVVCFNKLEAKKN